MQPLDYLTKAKALSRLGRPLLLLGERGSGKSTLARQLHSSGPFVAVNCAAIPEQLFEAELFGHERGAFTGAQGSRKGRFELAHGGTLFLDELGEVGDAWQAKLLAAVEQGEIWPVGASSPRRCSVRLLAATNRPRESLRPDLLDRFVAAVDLPRLEARQDLPFLAREAAKTAGHDLGCRVELAESCEAWIRAQRWPGNARELFNVVAVAAALAPPSPVVRLEPPQLEAAKPGARAQASPLLAAAQGLGEWFARSELESASGLGRSAVLEWLSRHAEHNGLQSTARRYRLT